MSVLFYPESIRILGSDANGNNVILCEMAVDDIANLPSANAFISDGYVLSMGCKAIAINDNSKHRLNGNGQWVQISAGTSTYTRAEIDAIISAIDADIHKQETALIDIIDTGAKNIFDTSTTSSTITDCTFTKNNDGTWTATSNGAVSARRQKGLYFNIPALQNGDYVLSGCPPGGASGTDTYYCLYVWDQTDSVRVSSDDTGTGIVFSWNPNPAHTYAITIDIRNGTNPDGLVFKPMICEKSKWDISNAYEQYAPTNRQLYEMILQLQGG